MAENEQPLGDELKTSSAPEIKGDSAKRVDYGAMPYNFSFIASEDETLLDVFERTYEGSDPGKKADYYATYEPSVPQLGADFITTRSRFVRELGIDPFKKTKEGKWVFDESKNINGKSIKELTLGDALNRIQGLRRQASKEGKILVRGKMVEDTKRNREEASRQRISVTGPQLSAYNQAIPIESAKEMVNHPIFGKAFNTWLFHSRDKGAYAIPLEQMKGLMQDAAEEYIEERYWFQRHGTSKQGKYFQGDTKRQRRMKPWSEVERGMRSGAEWNKEWTKKHGPKEMLFVDQRGTQYLIENHHRQKKELERFKRKGFKLAAVAPSKEIEMMKGMGLSPSVSGHYGRGLRKEYTEQQIQDRKKTYFDEKRKVIAAHSPKIPYLISRALERKGLVKSYVTITSKEFGPDVSTLVFEASDPELKRLVDSGLYEIRDVKEQDLPEAKKIKKKVTLTDPVSQDAFYRETAKKVGRERRYIRDGVKWAQGLGIDGYAQKVENAYGRDTAINTMLSMYTEHMSSMKDFKKWEEGAYTPQQKEEMKNPFGGAFRPAHALGKYGFANWHMAEGFETRDKFRDHIIDDLSERIVSREKALKGKNLSDAKRNEYKLEIQGYEDALTKYEKARKDREGVPLAGGEASPHKDPFVGIAVSRDYRLEPYTRNKYGMLVKTDPNAFLYAAYYDLFRKDGDKLRPMHSYFAGLTSPNPTYIELTPSRDLYGNKKYISGTKITANVGTVTAENWGEALSGGATSFRNFIEARMKQQVAIDKSIAKGENLSFGSGILHDVGAYGEQIAMAPGQVLQTATSAVDGLLSSGFKNVASLVATGKPWGNNKQIRRLSNSELQSLALGMQKHYMGRGRDKNKFGAWKANQLFLVEADRDAKLAKQTEDLYKGQLEKHVVDRVYTQINDIVGAIVGLPSEVFGWKTPNDYRSSGRNLEQRFTSTIGRNKELGYQMGSGTVDFLTKLVTKPVETIEAAPIDSIMAVLGPFKKIISTGKAFGKPVSEKTMRLVKKVVQLGDMVNNSIKRKTGFDVGSVINKTYSAAEPALIAGAKAFDNLREAAKQTKSNFGTALSSMFSLRELSSRGLLNKIHRGILDGGDLRDFATQIRHVAKEADTPQQLRDVIDALKATLGDELIKRTELKGIFEEFEVLHGQLKNLDEGQYHAKGLSDKKVLGVKLRSQKRYEKAVEDAKGNVNKFVEKLLDPSSIDPSVVKQEGIRNLLAPKELISVSEGIKHRVDIPYVHSDWAARNITLKALMDPGHPSLAESTILYADPNATKLRLTELRDAIADGTIPNNASEWLFGEAVDLNQSNQRLGMNRQYHSDLSGKRPITNEGLNSLVDSINRDPVLKRAVLDRLGRKIKELDEFEALSSEARSALGLKQRVKVDGGWIDQEFGHHLSTAKLDGARKPGIPDAGVDVGPNIYVRKGTNKKILNESGATAVPDVVGVDPTVTRLGLKKDIGKINEQLNKQGKPPIQPPEGKTWRSATSEELRGVLGEYYSNNGTLPPASSKLVNDLFGVTTDEYVRFKQSELKQGAQRIKERFEKTNETHGPVAAFNEMFGRDKGAPISISAIENIDGVADILTSLKPGVANDAINALRSQMVMDAVGPKKTVQSFADNLADRLDKIAAEKEGVKVRELWKKEGGAIDDVKSDMIGAGATGFVDDILNGKREPDLPPVLERNPKAIVADLRKNKEALRQKALDRGVSNIDFERSYNNAIYRLGRFDSLADNQRVKFGLGPGDDPVYIPNEVNSALRFQDMALTQIGGPVSYIKRNWTSRNIVTFVNNLVSSMSLQFGRTGRVVNPFRYRGLVEAYKKTKNLDKKISDAAKADLISEMKKHGITDMQALQDIMEVGKFLESGAFEIEFGGKSFSKLNPLRQLEEGYKFTDQGFKLDEAIRGYKQIDGAYNKLELGETIRLEINEGVFVTLKKTSSGADIIGPTGRVKRKLTRREVSKTFAESSSVMADRLFVNYSSLPKALAWMRSSKAQALGALAPMLTWAYKALWFPGKRGPASEFFRPTPYIKTSSRKVNADLANKSANASARAFIATQMGRERLEAMDPETMALALEYLPNELKARLVADMSDAGFLRTKDLQWLNPFGPTQTLFSTLRYGYWKAIEEDNLYGGEGEAFVGHWLGPDGNGGKRIMLNLTGEVGERGGYSKNVKLTKKGKELLKLRRYIVSQKKKGDGYGLRDLGKLTLLTGGPLRDFVNALSKAGEMGARPGERFAAMTNMGLGLFAGGAVARGVDVLVGIADKDSVFSSRHKVPLTPSGESSMRFAIRRLTGIGYDIKDVAKDKKKMLGKVRTNLKVAFLGDASDPDTLAGARAKYEKLAETRRLSEDERRGLRYISKKAERIEKIVDSEVHLLDHNLTTALNLRAAAIKRKGKPPGWKKKIVWEKRRLVRDGDKWIYVVEKDRPQVEQLYKVDKPPKGIRKIRPKRQETYKVIE